MGAWNFGIFDDDTAYDWFGEIKADPRGFFQRTFAAAAASVELEYDACHAVLVAAAYMDNLLFGTQWRNDNHEATDETNVNMFGSLHPGLPVADLRAPACEALQKVRGPGSELRELWAESELFAKWDAQIAALIDRLSA
jgi:Domain of unknown function (DUF4259)